MDMSFSFNASLVPPEPLEGRVELGVQVLILERFHARSGFHLPGSRAKIFRGSSERCWMRFLVFSIHHQSAFGRVQEK